MLGGRYALGSEIGRGGMGVVYRAHDGRLEREVAVKLLHPWLAQDEEGVARFRREARALAQLAHPHIVRLYDFEEEGEQAFIVMELIEGDDLDEHLPELPVAPATAQRLLEPVAAALAFAHAKGIVHRDIKPTNILVEEGGRVVVSDFGLARLAQGTQSITATGALVGSPEYWAPEQAQGREITAASDVYALGCVLYKLVTSHLPFEGEDRLAVGYRRVHEDAPDPRRHNPDLSAATADLVLSLLARDSAGRPTATELRAHLLGDHRQPRPELDPTERTVQLIPEAPTVVGRARSAPRSRAALILGILAAVILGGAGVAAGLLLRASSQAAPQTRERPVTRTQVVTRRTPARTVIVTKKERSEPPARPSATFAPFSGDYFSLDYPAAWTVETAEVSKGSYLDTTIRNDRDRSALIRVDVSPGGAGDPAAHAREVESYLERQRGYRRTAFDRFILNNYYEALWWEFVVQEQGVLVHKVDIFFSDESGNGFAILTQAPASSYGSYEPTFQRVRASLAPNQ